MAVLTALSPFVYWAQNEKCVFLKVDLKDVKHPTIQIETRKVAFQSNGTGARGFNKYAFTVDLISDINTKESVHKVTDSRVDFTLTKSESAWWPRLLSQVQKPVWLKIDHDRFQSEDMEDEVNDVQQDYPDLYEQLKREEFGFKKEDVKKVYLFIYNLFMFVGFLYVMSVLSVRYLRDGIKSFAGTYAAVGSAMCFLHLIQLLEVMHPLFGYVKGRILIPLVQTGGRLFILIVMLELEPRLQVMPAVFYLFFIYTTSEIIRYPYYLSRLLKRENKLLTWLRYTAWIVCYPVGFLCEGVIIFRNLIFLEQSGRWTLSLSTPFEVTLQFSTFLKIVLLFLIIPTMYLLMSHMYKLQKQKLRPKPIIRKIKTK